MNFCRPEQRQVHTDQGVDTQRAVYSGYYGGCLFLLPLHEFHARAGWGLKYLHCVWGNGMIAQICGPVDGRRHDGHLFELSRINGKLEHLSQRCGVPVHAHGDSAFPSQSHTTKGGGWEMNRKRICVEWTIGLVYNKWASLDMSAHNQMYLNRPGAKYLLACLLTNFHTCIYGNETTKYFSCQPPTLESYMDM